LGKEKTTIKELGPFIIVGDATILEQNKLCQLLIGEDKYAIEQKNNQTRTKGFI
jgi:hypothetical protein